MCIFPIHGILVRHVTETYSIERHRYTCYRCSSMISVEPPNLLTITEWNSKEIFKELKLDESSTEIISAKMLPSKVLDNDFNKYFNLHLTTEQNLQLKQKAHLSPVKRTKKNEIIPQIDREYFCKKRYCSCQSECQISLKIMIMLKNKEKHNLSFNKYFLRTNNNNMERIEPIIEYLHVNLVIDDLLDEALRWPTSNDIEPVLVDIKPINIKLKESIPDSRIPSIVHHLPLASSSDLFNRKLLNNQIEYQLSTNFTLTDLDMIAEARGIGYREKIEKFLFDILNMPLKRQNYLQHLFDIDEKKDHLNLILQRFLDRELYSEMYFKLSVRYLNESVNNEKENISWTVLHIIVLDVNDNSPKFLHAFEKVTFDENQPASPLIQLKAFDKDENNKLTFHLEKSIQNFQKWIKRTRFIHSRSLSSDYRQSSSSRRLNKYQESIKLVTNSLIKLPKQWMEFERNGRNIINLEEIDTIFANILQLNIKYFEKHFMIEDDEIILKQELDFEQLYHILRTDLEHLERFIIRNQDIDLTKLFFGNIEQQSIHFYFLIYVDDGSDLIKSTNNNNRYELFEIVINDIDDNLPELIHTINGIGDMEIVKNEKKFQSNWLNDICSNAMKISNLHMKIKEDLFLETILIYVMIEDNDISLKYNDYSVKLFVENKTLEHSLVLLDFSENEQKKKKFLIQQSQRFYGLFAKHLSFDAESLTSNLLNLAIKLHSLNSMSCIGISIEIIDRNDHGPECVTEGNDGYFMKMRDVPIISIHTNKNIEYQRDISKKFRCHDNDSTAENNKIIFNLVDTQAIIHDESFKYNQNILSYSNDDRQYHLKMKDDKYLDLSVETTNTKSEEQFQVFYLSFYITSFVVHSLEDALLNKYGEWKALILMIDSNEEKFNILSDRIEQKYNYNEMKRLRNLDTFGEKINNKKFNFTSNGFKSLYSDEVIDYTYDKLMRRTTQNHLTTSSSLKNSWKYKMTLGLAVAVGFILFLLAIAFIMATRKSNMIDKKRKRLFKQQQFRQKHVQMYLKDKNKDADKNDGNGMKMKEESFENPSPTIFNVLPKYSTEFAMKQFNPNEINLSRPLSHLEMERKKIEEIHRTIEGNESESTSSSQLPMNHSDQYNYYESNSNNNNNNNRQYDYSTQHRNKEEVLMIDVKEKDQSIRKTVRFNPSSPNMQLTRMHETQKWLQTNSSSSDEGCYGSSELSAVTQQQLKLHNNQIKRQSYDTVSDSITAEKEIIVPQRNNYDSSWSDSRNGKKCLMKNENENNHKIDYQLHKAQPVQLRWTKSLKEGEENHEEINNYGICRSKTLTQYSETNSSTSSNLSASNILTTGIVNASFRNFERLYHKTDSINNLINNEIADDSPNSLIVNADNNCLELTPKLLPRASFV